MEDVWKMHINYMEDVVNYLNVMLSKYESDMKKNPSIYFSCQINVE